MVLKLGKFGFVNNFLPYFYLERMGGADVVEASPKQLADQFASRTIDFAPVPSFYYLANKRALTAYDFCIAADGTVLSVIVVSRDGTLGDGPVAVTNQTATSVNLLRIIMKERSLANRLVPVDAASASELLQHAPHALVIGDEAITARMMYRVAMDLGEEWHTLTGLPMVFGIAVGRAGDDMSAANRLVLDSIAWGRTHLDTVVGEAVKRFGMPAEFLREYFSILTYTMGDREHRGLALFEEACHDHGLL